MRTRLLIADGDELLLGLEDRFFSARGFEVETAASGVECFERMRRFPPDVAIIDAHLPWGGGDGVLAAMQDDPSLACIPVVLLDGADLGWEATAPETVMHHCKPVSLATLLDSVRRAARQPAYSRGSEFFWA